MSRSGCEAPTTQRLRCIGQGLVPESKDHPATYLAAILDDAVGLDHHWLTDCQSVDNSEFAELLGNPVCQSCARFWEKQPRRAVPDSVAQYSSSAATLNFIWRLEAARYLLTLIPPAATRALFLPGPASISSCGSSTRYETGKSLRPRGVSGY
jgi:hypothetical protein